MGLGYILGCFFSILFMKIDKFKFMKKIYVKVKSEIFFFIILILFFIFLKIAFLFISNNEIRNFIIFMIIIDISNTEFGNLTAEGERHFYNSVSIITKALVGGFIGPLFYTALLGNSFALFYYLLFMANDITDNKFTNFIIKTLNIVPALIGDLILYLVYILKKKSFINFKGDFLINTVFNPLINLNIIAANLESINFYYIEDNYSIKNYVNGKGNIDIICIKKFLNHIYLTCLLTFILFIGIEIYFLI